MWWDTARSFALVTFRQADFSSSPSSRASAGAFWEKSDLTSDAASTVTVRGQLADEYKRKEPWFKHTNPVENVSQSLIQCRNKRPAQVRWPAPSLQRERWSSELVWVKEPHSPGHVSWWVPSLLTAGSRRNILHLNVHTLLLLFVSSTT